MTAQAELQAAQEATGQAVQALADLNARVDAGDATVTGSDLVAAEAQVAVANRLQAGAAARAEAETLARAVAEADAAHAKLLADYQDTSAALKSAVSAAYEDVLAVLTAASVHERTTNANRSAAHAYGPEALGQERFGQLRNGAPGVTPSFGELLDGLAILTSKAAGLPSSIPYPDTALEPIRRFLPAA